MKRLKLYLDTSVISHLIAPDTPEKMADTLALWDNIKSNKYNVPYGHKPDRFSKAYITKIVNQVNYFEFMIKVNNWNFLCQSYEDTLKLAKEDDFIYCDPPYIGRHVDYYDSWNETDEQKLYNCLRLTQAKFMLSTWEGNRYRKNDYIEKIWTNCNKISKEHFYFIGGFEENRNSMIEALLMNY
ncbi:MAG: DNA adenine methylase [Candidatus Cloacimonetes bacterium]|nr:DNA adenine methylase [Candidatus Cloacimonadota bacterium]